MELGNDDTIQEVVQALGEQERMKTFTETDQLTLGELIAYVENVTSNKYVVFDEGNYIPDGLGSWRGSYRELAIRYDVTGDVSGAPTAGEFLDQLRDAVGDEFTGYKGGQFTMNQQTPVWVANRGDSDGFIETDVMKHQGVVGVTESDYCVIIETAEVEF